MTYAIEHIPKEILAALTPGYITQQNLKIYNAQSVCDEIIDRIQRMAVACEFGVGAYFNLEDRMHRTAEELVAQHYGLSINPVNESLPLQGGSVLLNRTIQLEPIDMSPGSIVNKPRPIIGVYYNLDGTV